MNGENEWEENTEEDEGEMQDIYEDIADEWMSENAQKSFDRKAEEWLKEHQDFKHSSPIAKKHSLFSNGKPPLKRANAGIDIVMNENNHKFYDMVNNDIVKNEKK